MEFRELNPKKLFAYVSTENRYVKIDGYVIDNNDKTIVLYIKNDTARTFSIKSVVIVEQIPD